MVMTDDFRSDILAAKPCDRCDKFYDRLPVLAGYLVGLAFFAAGCYAAYQAQATADKSKQVRDSLVRLRDWAPTSYGVVSHVLVSRDLFGREQFTAVVRNYEGDRLLARMLPDKPAVPGDNWELRVREVNEPFAGEICLDRLALASPNSPRTRYLAPEPEASAE